MPNKLLYNQSILLLLLSLVFGNGFAASDSDCQKWMTNAAKSIESVPTVKRLEEGLRQLQTACQDAIPEKLATAAKQALQASSPRQRSAILYKATAPFYPADCQTGNGRQPAKTLPPTCLENDYPRGPYSAILHSVDSGAYLYGKLIEKQLEKAGLDEHQRRRFMRNYFLGAALAFEAGN